MQAMACIAHIDISGASGVNTQKSPSPSTSYLYGNMATMVTAVTVSPLPGQPVSMVTAWKVPYGIHGDKVTPW